MLCTVLVLASVACGAADDPGGSADAPPTTVGFEPIVAEPPAVVDDGPLAPDEVAAAAAFVADPLGPAPGTVADVAATGDIRLAWLLADALRLGVSDVDREEILDGLAALVGAVPPAGQDPWASYIDLLVRWDVPVADGYDEWKQQILLSFEPMWRSLLEVASAHPAPAGSDAALDWRVIAPGEVSRDEVSVLEAPAMVAGESGRWLPDDDRVVGVVLGGEARAYPLRVIGAHEVVEDSAGGESVVVVHDTRSGTVAAYRPAIDDGPVRLAVSGLTSYGADLLYDTESESLVDPLRGAGVSGPWSETGVRLPRLPFTLTTWGEWRQAHPDSMVVAVDGGVGRVYLSGGGFDPLPSGRPAGDVDDRMAVGARVLGVEAAGSSAGATPVAFPLEDVELALLRGEEVRLGGVELALDAGGVTASADGERLAAVVASWADWSRMHPGTAVWS